jgi:hypothetical protein
MNSNHGLISSRESAAKSKRMMTTVVGELETVCPYHMRHEDVSILPIIREQRIASLAY